MSRGAKTRQAILAAAITRFGRDGYRATSVADIARDAGVGGTVAYAYFAGKEALFLAAADEDVAALVTEGLAPIAEAPETADLPRKVMFGVLGALNSHPLARRLLAGLEPEVTERVMEVPALLELRKTTTERLRADQLAGLVRSDVDPTSLANGIVTITLSLLMSVVQLGEHVAETYGDDVLEVIDASLRSPQG